MDSPLITLCTYLSLAGGLVVAEAAKRLPLLRNLAPAVNIFGTAALFAGMYYLAGVADPAALGSLGLTEFIMSGLTGGAVTTAGMNMLYRMRADRKAGEGHSP